MPRTRVKSLREPENETLEQRKTRYTEIGHRIAVGRRQNANATEDDLQVQAIRYADSRIANEAKAKQESLETRLKAAKKVWRSDEQYREEKRATYEEVFEWNTANDKAQLDHIIELEVQFRQINRELEDVTLSATERDKLRIGLTKITAEHRQMQKDLGIDKPAREKKSSSGTPMDDWNRIKQEAKIKKDQQREEFVKLASEVTNEADLREMIKYGFVTDFTFVDAILSNHRRVLDLPTEISKN